MARFQFCEIYGYTKFMFLPPLFVVVDVGPRIWVKHPGSVSLLLPSGTTILRSPKNLSSKIVWLASIGKQDFFIVQTLKVSYLFCLNVF
jgi:hypothetical protein